MIDLLGSYTSLPESHIYFPVGHTDLLLVQTPKKVNSMY